MTILQIHYEKSAIYQQQIKDKKNISVKHFNSVLHLKIISIPEFPGWPLTWNSHTNLHSSNLISTADMQYKLDMCIYVHSYVSIMFM